MKCAVITGCTGVVGISIINELLQNNWAVVAVSRENSLRLSEIPKHKSLQCIECNLEDIEKLPELISCPCDAFFHLAWDGTYGSERLDSIRQNRNVEYTLKAVSVAKKLGCSVFVGAGSQSEYGDVKGVLHSGILCKPNNPYGAAKLSACHSSRILCRQLGMRHVWCRILSMYGPNDGKHTLIMTLIQTLIKGESPKCTRGDQVWDYIYSKDAAKAFRLVAEKGQDGAIYCLGSGKVRLLKEYIQVIRDEINPDLPIGFGEIDYYPNQVMHLEADISELQCDTGFSPEYTFELGIKETIEWCRNNWE